MNRSKRLRFKALRRLRSPSFQICLPWYYPLVVAYFKDHAITMSRVFGRRRLVTYIINLTIKSKNLLKFGGHRRLGLEEAIYCGGLSSIWDGAFRGT